MIHHTQCKFVLLLVAILQEVELRYSVMISGVQHVSMGLAPMKLQLSVDNLDILTIQITYLILGEYMD